MHGKLNKLTIPSGDAGYEQMWWQPIRRLELSHVTHGIILDKHGRWQTESVHLQQCFPMVPRHRGKQVFWILVQDSLSFHAPTESSFKV